MPMGVKRLLTLAVSCSVAVILLGLAAWMLVGRGDRELPDSAVQIIPPAGVDGAAATSVENPTTPAASPDEAAVPEEIAVYITGAVVNPGVYTATTEHRLDAVLKLAGGPTEDADLNRINLAAYVTDASHYRIPSVKDPQQPAAAASASSGTAQGETAAVGAPCAMPIDINAASADCLETLPGIGSVRAEAIVAHRERAGPFATTADITAVSGIGDGIYQRIAEMITVNQR